MPNLNVNFQGTPLIIPGAYYADNVSNAFVSAQPTTPPLIYLGYGYGQKPQVPVTYNDPQSLLAAMRGGPCSGYVPFLVSPSGQLFGAQQVTYINVGENTQSSLTLYSGTSGVVTLTSANYGLPSNQLQAQVQTGTVAGKNITLYDQYSNVRTSGANLGVPFQLAYTGAATGVTYSVTVSGANALTFSTSSPNAGESVTVPLSSYNTVEAVVNYLNGTGFYYAYTISSTNGSLPSAQLDAASGIALAKPVSGVNQYVNVSATIGDVVYWVNQYASAFATAVSGAFASSTAVAPTNIPFTLFSGATSVPPTNSDYASGFNVALSVNGWAVFADSNASGVIALGSQHASTASTPSNGKFRRFFSGSSVGDTVASAVAAAQSMDSISSTYVYPGIYRTNVTTGQNVLYGGLAAAAAAAGMATGNGPATPLTNKALTGNGVETQLTSAQVDQLQQSGVMPIWVSPQTGVPTIISDFTTWQNDSNPENVFNQQVACRFATAYALVAALQPFVGTVASPLNETNILNAAKATLNGLLNSNNNTTGTLASWDTTSLQLVYTGSTQTAAVTVNVVLVGQNRFVTMFVNILPLLTTISVTAQSSNTPV